jgi:hypothetical protein
MFAPKKLSYQQELNPFIFFLSVNILKGNNNNRDNNSKMEQKAVRTKSYHFPY